MQKQQKFAFKTWKTEKLREQIRENENLYGDTKKVLDTREQDLNNLINFTTENAGLKHHEVFRRLHQADGRFDSLQMKVLYTLNSKSLKNDEYLKPLFLQKWKNWVKFRKVFKHWVEHCEVQAQEKNSDNLQLYKCFRKWKYSFSDQEKKLKSVTFENIKERAILTNDANQELETEIENQKSTISELDTQNKVLVDNTISGQKLALSICKENFRKKKSSTFKNWAQKVKNTKLQEKQKKLKENMELIVNLRLKIKEMDMDNQDLIHENDQLRRTSMDGIFLAQTWKELSEKIKVLSVDLEDKSEIVQNLLDENNGLAQNISVMQTRANQVMGNY